MIRVGIVGGGASGLMAAITAADNKALVTVFERKDKIGKKILATGNGRCNFSNKKMSASCYYTDDVDFVAETLNNFSVNDLVHFFVKAGVLCKEKNGYMYPASEQASTVLDALKYELRERNVDIVTDCDIVKVERHKNTFFVYSAEGAKYEFDKIIISTGGKAGLPKSERANGYTLLRELGINSTRTYPALTSLSCSGLNFKNISGVRSECNISLIENGNEIMKDSGEVLFNDNGISGIVVFQISHAALESIDNQNKVSVTLDLLPGLSENDLVSFVSTKYMLHPELTAEEFFTGLHNKKLCSEIMKSNDIDSNSCIADMPKDKIIRTVLQLKNLRLNVLREAGYDKAQVTGGGIPLNTFTSSFEVKTIPGLYVTGELLNVDGICGGYNLQWAFSSGYIAGLNAAATKSERN